MKIITKIVRKMLANAELPKEDRIALSTELMDKLGALPFSDIIDMDSEGRMTINDRPLASEEMIQLRESAKTSLHSQVRKLIKSQIIFNVAVGVDSGDTLDKIMFAKSILWFKQEEEKLLRTLAQE